jgi:PAS domain S-box-containing protein
MKRRSISLRGYLVILLLCTLTPITVFAAWLVFNFAKGEREGIEKGLRDTNRALATALDREFQSGIAALNVLANSKLLDKGQFDEFYRLAERTRATQPGWKAIMLHEPSGHAVAAAGVSLRGIEDRESFEKVVKTKKPAVAELVKTRTGRWVFGVRVPVIRQREVLYVLSAFIDPSRIATIMKEQNLPSSWLGTIHDQKRHAVAHTRFADRFIGQQPAMLESVPADAVEGSVRGYNHEAELSYSFFQKSPFSGWHVELNVPARFLDSPLERSLLLMSGAGLIALMFGILSAMFMSEYINDCIRRIRKLAQALGRRQEIKDIDHSPISEVNSITEALHDAAAVLQQAEAKQRQTEEELRESNNQLEQRVARRTATLQDEMVQKQTLEDALRSQALLLQLTHDAIIVRSWDDGRIQFWNQGATEIYGWTADEAVGKILPDLIHSRYQEPFKDIEEKLKRDGHWQGEVIHTRKDGTELILESRWSVRRDSDDRPVAILELNSDITTRKYAEQKIQENEWLAGLGTMMAMFAHEIANPLNAISTSLEVVEMEIDGKVGVDTRVKKTLESSTQEIVRLASLLNEFRTIARPQAPKLKSGDLGRLIKDVLVPQAAVCQKAGITINRELEDLRPILMDENKMKQVILNLCKNAIEAMPNGGVLTVRAYQVENTTVVEVSDTGVGIPPGVDVFQLFKTTKADGTGLGLSVVRQIIHAHQGRIEYQTEVGEGTTFKIYLPEHPTGEAANHHPAAGSDSVRPQLLNTH